jgi:Peptidase A4 family
MFPGGTVQEGTQACINNNVDCPRPGDRISASVSVAPGTAGNNNYTLSLTDYTQPQNNFSVTQPCATDVCLDQSAEWIIERPAFAPGGSFQILPLVDYFQTGMFDDTQTSGGTSGSIADFTGGPVYDVQMVDDSVSYFLDCVGQFGPPGQLLLLSNANACPVVSPSRDGSFITTWDSSF